MRILVGNKYFYRRAGAELVALDTAELLRSHGHEISYFSMVHPQNLPSDFLPYFVSNVDYEQADLLQAATAAGRLLYSFEARSKIERLVQDHRPDVAHLHNIYHQLSPSVLHGLKKYGIPIVLTLHDYKIVCASYSMVVGGKICEACKNGRYYQCFLKSCVKRSRMKSLLNTMEMYLHHSVLDIYGLVDVFISPSKFLKDKVAEMGFKGRVVHIPNCVRAEGFVPRYGSDGNVICYIGRLAETKGIETLIRAVKGLDVELRIIGAGPNRDALEACVKSEGMQNVVFTGYMTGAPLEEEIRRSMFTVIPSEWYENNPRSVIEAFALGKPVVGARIGGIPELVRDGETGYTFTAFSAEDLREKIVRLANDPAAIERMGRNARRFVEEELNAEVHYQRLMDVYRSVMK